MQVAAGFARRMGAFFLVAVGCGSGASGAGPVDAGTVDAADGAGGEAGPADGGEAGPPPSLLACAGPLDRTAATLFYDAARCLFEGNDPPQKGVAPGTISKERVAVVRGLVLDPSGQPLAGVRVTAVGHAELGQTTSRADGWFDMAVNGGGLVTLRYEKTGLLPVQRHRQAPWRAFTVYPDATLVAEAPSIAVDLGSMSGPVMVEQPISTDASGARHQALVIPRGTQATLVLPNGNKQALTSFHVRITEYTVGAQGPAAMPGDLPDTSGYTYANEFSVDEARAAGASEVDFDPAVISYVENFLHFPAGTAVPSGWYDTAQDVWKAGDNGIVLGIVSVTAGKAAVDADGDGQADDAASLATLGVTDDELAVLGQKYAAGQSVWRVPLAHFSSWDANWGFGPPRNAIVPKAVLDFFAATDCKTHAGGSIIGCEDQTLGEALPISGTPLVLHYQSERTPGRTDAARLSLTIADDALPPSVKRIDVEAEVLGQVTKRSYPPMPNTHDAFIWDGKDAYGRYWQGRQLATVRVGYVYDGTYEQTKRFGYAGNGVPITGDKTRQELTLWSTRTAYVGAFDAGPLGFGGWTLENHHFFDPRGRVLYLGDGRRRSAELLGDTIETIVGDGISDSTGDEGPAAKAEIDFPHGLVVGPDGTVYVAEDAGNRIRRIAPDGTIHTYAGTGIAGFGGDEGPATMAMLNRPMGLALGRDGTLYVADSDNARVRSITSDGIIHTFAGGGAPTARGADDGKPATEANFATPHALALGGDGSLYVADLDNLLIRRVGPDGTISTLAGLGTSTADGDLATSASVQHALGLAVSPDNELYFTESFGNRVRKIDKNGRVWTVVGADGAVDEPADGLAKDTTILAPHTVDVGPDGSLYITEEGRSRVRRVRPDGRIETVAGGGTRNGTDVGDHGPATLATFALPRVVYLHKDGSLWIADFNDARIRRVIPPLPDFAVGEVVIPAEDAGELYVFDDHGRHLRTVDPLTRVELWSFGYDTKGQLSSVQDRDGNATTITRDAVSGKVTITGPFGQATELAIGADGYLAGVTNANREAVTMTYATGGLLTALTDPRQGSVHRYEYDPLGRLIKDTEPSGAFQALTRTETGQGYSVALATPLGRTKLHQVDNLVGGQTRRTVTSTAGISTAATFSPMGVSVQGPTSQTTVTLAGDPRFGVQAPYAATTEHFNTISGLSTKVQRTRTFELSNPNDPLSVVSFTELTTHDDDTSRAVWDAASHTLTSTSPEGRTATQTFDAKGHLVRTQLASLLPSDIAYDDRGRPVQITRGTRSVAFTYGADGYLGSITDPLGRVTSYKRDPVGRVLSATLPDQSVAAFGWDANGNMTSLTPPGGAAHGFEWSPDDLLGRYQPPSLSTGSTTATSYTYNRDDQLATVTRPDGLSITPSYEANSGRVSALALPEGSISYAYDGTTGKLTSASGTDETTSYKYNGDLVDSVAWSGAVGRDVSFVSYAYDRKLRVIRVGNFYGESIYQYDRDDLVTSAGALGIHRDPGTGAITGTTFYTTNDSFTYDGYGDLAAHSATAGTTALYSDQVMRDALGRVASRVETVLGEQHAYEYHYDARDRLTDVLRDGTTIEHDAYDANGNRTESSGVPATYDAQDRLVRRGDTAYTLGPNGELASKTLGGATTTYAYDTRGNLKSVALPGGKTIDYVLDPAGRRVGKKINGQLVQGFLYDGARPVAELDAAGLLVSFFTYASRAHVPDFIVKDNAPYRLITDERGSVRLVVRAATEEVVQRIDYDAWGNVTSDTNPGFQPFGFAGGFYDSDTGLVRFGARDYDAASGRWTSKDPSGVAASANVYAYADNDPINRIDTDGHFAILIPVLIGAGEGAISNAFISIVEQSVSNGCIDWGRVGHDALVGGVIGGLSGGLVGLVAGDACAAGVCRGGGLCFAAGTPVVTESGLVPIEQLRVEDRVVADNLECATDHIDASSQTVALELDDGSAGSVHVEALRPSTWLEGDGLATRGRAWVDLPELKVSGWGTIIHVGPAPPEKPGDGCLVLTTVNQVADQLLRLRFAETTDELELTPSHRLYVEGRGWVAAQAKGDTLRAESGGVTVLAVERVAGQRVYNLEVGREHSYRVLAGGVWAHNACGGGGGAAEATAPGIARLLPGSLPAEEEAALLDTLGHIERGTVPAGPTATRWGVPFNNIEGELPGVPGALPTPYTEFRVAPGPGVSGAGARRIVVDNASSNMFYTWTHYGQSGDPAFLLFRW